MAEQAARTDDWGDDSDDDLLANVDLSEAGINEALRGTSVAQEEAAPTGGIVPMMSVLSGDCTPLEKLRRGYLWVSDMVSQNWCEHQMVYRMTVPGVVVESPAMAAGSNLHLARELEVQDYVKVEVTSNEDIFAVKVVNLLAAVLRMLSGSSVCREVPIFGAPFGQEIFFMGMIDELRADPQTMELELVELKTRTVHSMPSAAHRNSHKLQTMIYKKLFDDLVRGRITKQKIAETLGLDFDRPLGASILEHVLSVDHQPRKNLDSLMDCLLEKMQSLTCIRGILIEYCYQKDGSTIGFDQFDYDETWFKPIFDNYAMFWKGRRQACGVDIEEAWKCQKCDFADICEWRDNKSRQYAEKNTGAKTS